MTSPPAGEIRVTIDEVVLRGVPPGQEGAVVAGLRHELEQLVRSDPTALTRPAATASRMTPPRGDRVPVRDATALGSRAATRIWTSLREGR